jgi:hypothetical protein
MRTSLCETVSAAASFWGRVAKESESIEVHRFVR